MMKKNRVLLMVILLSAFTTYGQKEKKMTLKEKIQAKLDKANENFAAKQKKKGGAFPTTEESQSVTASTFESKTYDYWKSNGSYTGGSPDEQNKIEIVKGADGKVKHIVLEDKVKYLPDENGKSDFVRYFKSEKNEWCMFFAKNRIFFFTFANRNRTEEVDITWKGVAGKAAPYDYIPKIENYLNETRKNQTADLEQYAKDKKAKEAADLAARKKKYSIEGKQVTSVKIINLKQPKHFGNYEGSIHFDVVATLKDGTKISTTEMNTGFKSDYIIEYKNMPGKRNHYSKNAFSNSYQTGFVKDDKIVLSVKSKYNPALKDSKDVLLTYTYAKGGTGFDWSARKYGYSGDNLKFEITSDKHAVTGAPLYKYRVTNLTRNIVITEAKIAHNQILQLWAKGQPGKPHHHGADDNTRGGDGGNGGVITIYKDPSVKSIDFIDTKVFGGRGGKGSYSGLDGRPGRDGKVNVVTQAVKF